MRFKPILKLLLLITVPLCSLGVEESNPSPDVVATDATVSAEETTLESDAATATTTDTPAEAATATSTIEEEEAPKVDDVIEEQTIEEDVSSTATTETVASDAQPEEIEKVEEKEEPSSIASTEDTTQADKQEEEVKSKVEETPTAPVQSGPFIDLLGPTLLSLEIVDQEHAQYREHYTNEALTGKKVVGLYFSADWCGPCRKFTPELVKFYNMINARRGKEKEFEIVWISRCRDVNSYGQYFTHMDWLAMRPEDAMGEKGNALSDKYKVKGIPSLVLLDEVGNVIITDAPNKIQQDKAGIGFPWRNPLVTLYITLFPKSLRLLLKNQVRDVKEKVLNKLKGTVGIKL